MSFEIEVNDGKYKVIFDIRHVPMLRALRYGEEWRHLVGDNLVYWLSLELFQAREKIKELETKLEDCEDTKDDIIIHIGV